MEYFIVGKWKIFGLTKRNEQIWRPLMITGKYLVHTFFVFVFSCMAIEILREEFFQGWWFVEHERKRNITIWNGWVRFRCSIGIGLPHRHTSHVTHIYYSLSHLFSSATHTRAHPNPQTQTHVPIHGMTKLTNEVMAQTDDKRKTMRKKNVFQSAGSAYCASAKFSSMTHSISADCRRALYYFGLHNDSRSYTYNSIRFVFAFSAFFSFLFFDFVPFVLSPFKYS